MKRYDSYKDSGIEWIGEIPSHWKKIKFSYITNLMTCGHASTPEYVEEGGIPFLSAQNIKNEKLDLTVLKQVPISLHESLIKNKKVEKGDLLQVRVGGADTIGQTAIVDLDFDFSIYVSLAHIKLNELAFNGYVKHLCNSLEFKEFCGVLMKKGAGVANLNVSDVASMLIPLPSLNEQISIANYLDQKTSHIDDLIAKKERLIQLLEEERTAIINQAVTKGLDPTVPMKDSGIEWLGEIPAHWEVAKFNLFITIRHGHQFMNYDFTDDGIKVVKITQLHKDGYLDLSKCSYVSSEQLENYQSILIKEKDILMCLTGGTIGKIIRVGEVNEPLLQNYRVGHFSSGDVSKISDDFIFWLMSSESIVSQILFQMRETGQPNIGMEDFGRMRITIPPLEEQEGIVKYILNKTSEISEILIKSKQEIELLKEYKTALISEVVTGKVDVRNEKLN
jgi:type I restriction enzyme S subunit